MDVSTATPSGAPSGDIASSGNNGEQASSSADVTTQPENGQSQAEGTASLPSVPEYLKDIPTAEELRQQAEQKVPYAAGLANLRTVLETLQPQHDTLQSQVSQWQSVIEKYQTPENFQSAFEVGRGLFTETDQLDHEGLPVRTALPGLQKLAETNEADFLKLIEDGLFGFTYNGKPLIDRYLPKRGLNPDKIEQYQQWEKEPPEAGIAPEQLDRVPKEFREAFNALPAYVQKDRLQMDDEALQWQLEQDNQNYEGKKQQGLAQQRQQQEVQQAIRQNVDQVSSQRFQSGFAEIVKDLAPVAFTPNSTVNSILQQSLAHMMVNVAFDSTMDFTHGDIKSVVEQLDPEIRPLRETFQKQTEAAERYKEYLSRTKDGRYSIEQAEAERMAETAALKLQAKVSGLTSTFVKFLSSQLAEAQGAEDAASLNGRPHVSGSPVGVIASGGINPNWSNQYIRR